MMDNSRGKKLLHLSKTASRSPLKEVVNSRSMVNTPPMLPRSPTKFSMVMDKCQMFLDRMKTPVRAITEDVAVEKRCQ